MRSIARLPDVDIQRLKTEVSLVRLVEAQGHVVKRQGKDFAIRCSFHEGDDTASLVITPAASRFHYFACEAAGSVLDWVLRTRGLSFRFACEILQEDAKLVAPREEIIPCEALIDAMCRRLRGSHARSARCARGCARASPPADAPCRRERLGRGGDPVDHLLGVERCVARDVVEQRVDVVCRESRRRTST